MFFRRERRKSPTFAERLETLRAAGFAVEGSRVERAGCGAVVNANGIVGRAGMIMGAEIGNLVDAGYQKFFRTPSGKRRPALAEELKALHDFESGLKEALGLANLYNESLGTVSTFYHYDRLEGRE
jgi:hypothetical protein